MMKPASQAGVYRRGPYRSSSAGVIRRFRLAKDMTQPEAAVHCRVSLRTFQRAESGDVVPVAVKRAIERALGASW